MLGQGLWGRDRDRFAAIDAHLVGARTDGPTGEQGPVDRAQAGVAAEAGAAELAQHLVALRIQAQRATGQLNGALGIKEHPHHQAAGAGREVAAVVA